MHIPAPVCRSVLPELPPFSESNFRSLPENAEFPYWPQQKYFSNAEFHDRSAPLFPPMHHIPAERSIQSRILSYADADPHYPDEVTDDTLLWKSSYDKVLCYPWSPDHQSKLRYNFRNDPKSKDLYAKQT